MVTQVYFTPAKEVDTKALYRTMHCTLDSYMTNNQGLFCLPDWIGLIRNTDGAPLHHWDRQIEGDEFAPNILEVGCGNGMLCDYLELFAFVTGVDITDSPTRQQGKKDYTFCEMDITVDELPSTVKGQEADYDYILSFDVLEHLHEFSATRVIDTMQAAGRELLIKVACSGAPPLHVTVKPPGWWLSTLMEYAPNHNWSIIRNYRRQDNDGKDIFAPLFYGRKEK